MMESSSSSTPCVPPGFRFHPTDEELVGYYLRKKVASQRIDLDVIRDIDLYRIEPWDLQEKCRIGYEEQNEFYFFSHKDKKYPTGTRTNRATMAGFWKATGRDKAVYDKHKLIGMRKTLVFYKGRAPNGQKSDWIMHEYRLESEENAPPQEEGWVVCRAFKKRNTSQTKTNTIEGWDTPYFSYEELINTTNITSSSVLDPSIADFNNNNINNISRMQPPTFLPPLSFMCKQELEAESLKFLHASSQLPQLESPSLPIIKNHIPTPISSVDNNNSKKVTTDWRDLDKFVATQLMSHKEGETTKVSNFENQSVGGDYDEMGLLLLQSSREEVDKLNGLLGTSSSSDFDIGICIFDGK
ncbi:hypothetical protein Leryth_024938 [Lithospermum erythrorhizon]|uniref:NAC domain-containing protein n=1 Tax=Lithospermum erythrorhizon TaxID=34254 RepID=A0AAV3Q724_LITER|nr:hypothetical protein Leryth_024938 [Lithospermum erythrorhizon]